MQSLGVNACIQCLHTNSAEGFALSLNIELKLDYTYDDCKFQFVVASLVPSLNFTL